MLSLSRFAALVALALCAVPALAQKETVCAQDICIETVQDNEGLTIFALSKKQALPVSVTLKLDTTNLRIVEGSDKTFVLPGNKKRFVARLEPPRAGRWRWQYSFSWARGDFTARHKNSHVYRIPFEAGKSVSIGQGCNGQFSHFGPARFSLDFEVPVGTPIFAARGGQVVDVVENNTKGGPTREFLEFDNRIVIQHSDKTMSVYSHLKYRGAEVRVGQKVRQDQLIGYSGNTGFSTAPHLHFAVTRGTAEDSEQTIRVKFATQSGRKSCPKAGSFVAAVN